MVRDGKCIICVQVELGKCMSTSQIKKQVQNHEIVTFWSKTLGYRKGTLEVDHSYGKQEINELVNLPVEGLQNIILQVVS